LKDWIHNDHLQPAITKKLDDWFEAGLQQWDISRDSPYFGFQIPETENKYFYVWLDAPIGYMATFKNYCISNPQVDFDEYWKKDSNVELYHFVGKDIIYFHALFWPAMLQGSGFRTPNAIFAHGFLTVNGKKMSKSRGTFITARQYLDHLDPDYIRYYFAAKLGSSIDDIDLNFEDFVNRVNSDLVGKFVNIASRCAGFIHKKFDGMLSSTLCEPELFAEFLSEGEKIKGLLHDREYNTAIRSIMTLADKANQYIADKAPWTLAKQEDTLDEVQQICTMGLNLFRQLALFLKPITPALIERSEQFLNNELHTWDEAKHPLLNHKINEFQSLIQRIESTTIDAIIQPETV
jgi:methionyl-tRNA synthetase